MKDVPARARGKWQHILLRFGFTQAQLGGRHQACPVTGEKGSGSPRFRFSNKDGRGNYFCSCSDGKEDGFALLQCRFGWDFKKACEEVGKMLPDTSYDNDVKKKADKATAENRIKSIEAVSGDLTKAGAGPVVSYLANRGLTNLPQSLRYAYTDYGIGRKDLIAMVARIRNEKNEPISLHLTYIDPATGKKADIESPRIICTPTAPTIKGGAVRLYRAGPILGVAEGIETAISAAMLFGLPVWAVLSTAGMESFVWPETTKELVIFGDNDLKFAGQKAAYTLAYRASTGKNPIKVRVNIPNAPGMDWNDVLRNPVTK